MTVLENILEGEFTQHDGCRLPLFQNDYLGESVMPNWIDWSNFFEYMIRWLSARALSSCPKMLRSNTTAQLNDLRKQFLIARQCGSSQATSISAFLIPSVDAHQVVSQPLFSPRQSEYIADCDKRRAFISGFDGSAGDENCRVLNSGNVIVTLTDAALFTDGRYFLQAEQQLDSNWELVKTGIFALIFSLDSL